MGPKARGWSMSMSSDRCPGSLPLGAVRALKEDRRDHAPRAGCRKGCPPSPRSPRSPCGLPSSAAFASEAASAAMRHGHVPGIGRRLALVSARPAPDGIALPQRLAMRSFCRLGHPWSVAMSARRRVRPRGAANVQIGFVESFGRAVLTSAPLGRMNGRKFSWLATRDHLRVLEPPIME